MLNRAEQYATADQLLLIADKHQRVDLKLGISNCDKWSQVTKKLAKPKERVSNSGGRNAS